MFRKPFIKVRVIEEPKTIIPCERCGQKLRIPRSRKRITVACPRCRHEFKYQYFALGVSTAIISQLKYLNLSKYLNEKKIEAMLPGLLGYLGILFIIGGFVLVIGNQSGKFPTVPFAGYIVGTIGIAMLVTAVRL